MNDNLMLVLYDGLFLLFSEVVFALDTISRYLEIRCLKKCLASEGVYLGRLNQTKVGQIDQVEVKLWHIQTGFLAEEVVRVKHKIKARQ